MTRKNRIEKLKFIQSDGKVVGDHNGAHFYTIGQRKGLNIGGKPNFTYVENILAFIPISFEFTVLCAAHGMAITYLILNRTLPGMPAQNPDPRTTDDKFVMEIRMSENEKLSEDTLEALLKETGYEELEKKIVS